MNILKDFTKNQTEEIFVVKGNKSTSLLPTFCTPFSNWLFAFISLSNKQNEMTSYAKMAGESRHMWLFAQFRADHSLRPLEHEGCSFFRIFSAPFSPPHPHPMSSSLKTFTGHPPFNCASINTTFMNFGFVLRFAASLACLRVWTRPFSTHIPL